MFKEHPRVVVRPPPNTAYTPPAPNPPASTSAFAVVDAYGRERDEFLRELKAMIYTVRKYEECFLATRAGDPNTREGTQRHAVRMTKQMTALAEQWAIMLNLTRHWR